MYYVTFRIEETTDGEFVLYLHNHSQKKVVELLRSENLDAVVDRLKKERKYRHAFTSALGNYAPVLGFQDQLEEKYPEAKTETFPAGWKDPFDLYGEYRHELEDPRLDLDRERADLLKLLDKEGPEWVWKYRLKLVAESIHDGFLMDSPPWGDVGSAHFWFDLVAEATKGAPKQQRLACCPAEDRSKRVNWS